jgi:hypothetical protein
MSLRDLIAGLGNDFTDDDPWIRVTDATWTETDVDLRLSVRRDSDEEPSAYLRVHCGQVRDFLMSDVNGGGLNFHEGDHIALRLLSEETADLYFNGTAKDPYSILGRLYEEHRNVCDDWKPFDAYINRHWPSSELLAGGYGLLASGPKFLLECYSVILLKAGLNPRIANCMPAKYWNGSNWIDQSAPLKLLQFGESYVIAETFEAEKVKRVE